MIQQVVEMLQMFIEAEQKINSNYEEDIMIFLSHNYKDKDIKKIVQEVVNKALEERKTERGEA